MLVCEADQDQGRLSSSFHQAMPLLAYDVILLAQLFPKDMVLKGVKLPIEWQGKGVFELVLPLILR